MALKRFFDARFVVGLIFLFNPVVGLFDVLPDFVGFLLLFSALTEIAYLDDRLENARRMTLYGAAVSGARTVLMFFFADMDESWILSVVSLLGAAELYAALYFTVSFFGGITYVAERCESDNVLGDVDRVRNLWVAFWIVHTACTILPELAALPQLTLQHDPYVYPGLTERKLLLYKNGVIAVLFLVSLIMGLVWLFKTARFLKGVRRDAKFKTALSERYGNFLLANPLQETYLAARLACVLFAVGCALQINFALDGVFVLPAWAGTLFLAAGVFRLGARDFKNPCGYPLLAAAFVVQAVCDFFPLSGAWGYVCPPLLAVASFAAVFFAEKLFTARVNKLLNWDLEGGFMLARLPFAVFLVTRAVYGLYPNYWFYFAHLAAFLVWMFIILKLCSDLMGEIKARRRL